MPGFAAFGDEADVASTPGGPGSINSHLRLITAQLSGFTGGGGGAISIADGADITLGAIADAAVVGNNSGTVNAHLRGLTQIINDVWDSTAHQLKTSASLSLSGGISVGNVGQGTGNAGGSPWAVSGTVSIGNTPSVSVSNTPNVSVTNVPSVSVSGTATVSVSNTPNVAVTNTPNVSVTNTPNVAVSNVPSVSVSGTATVSVSNTPNVAVTNTPSVNINLLPNPVGVSGTVSIGGTPSVNINLLPTPVGVSGSVSVSNFPATQAVSVADGSSVALGSLADAAAVGDVSGSVNAHLRAISKLLNATLTVSVSNTPNVAVTNVPSVSVSGTATVSVSNTPNVSVTNTPNVAVTNTPSVNVNLFPTPLGVSGTVTANQGGTWTVGVNNFPAIHAISGSVTALNQGVTFTDRSGTISASGTSQQVMAANTSRKYLLVQNVSSGSVWINLGATATMDQPSLLLGPSGNFIMESAVVCTSAVNIIASIAGLSFTAKEA